MTDMSNFILFILGSPKSCDQEMMICEPYIPLEGKLANFNLHLKLYKWATKQW